MLLPPGSPAHCKSTNQRLNSDIGRSGKGLGVRFELIDRVVERQKDRLVALKCVSRAEEYLADHFPNFAVLPGVMMLESLVQAGRTLLDEPNGNNPLVLAEARNVRYANIIQPGQTLRVEVNLRKKNARGWEFDGIGRVNEQVAVQARFVLESVSRQIEGSTMDSDENESSS